VGRFGFTSMTPLILPNSSPFRHRLARFKTSLTVKSSTANLPSRIVDFFSRWVGVSASSPFTISFLAHSWSTGMNLRRTNFWVGVNHEYYQALGCLSRNGPRSLVEYAQHESVGTPPSHTFATAQLKPGSHIARPLSRFPQSSQPISQSCQGLGNIWYE